MRVELSEKGQEFIDRKLSEGVFSDAASIVDAALNRWAVEEMNFKPGELDALLKPALEQIARGEAIPLDKAMEMLEEHKTFRAKRLGA